MEIDTSPYKTAQKFVHNIFIPIEARVNKFFKDLNDITRIRVNYPLLTLVGNVFQVVSRLATDIA